MNIVNLGRNLSYLHLFGYMSKTFNLEFWAISNADIDLYELEKNINNIEIIIIIYLFTAAVVYSSG